MTFPLKFCENWLPLVVFLSRLTMFSLFIVSLLTLSLCNPFVTFDTTNAAFAAIRVYRRKYIMLTEEIKVLLRILGEMSGRRELPAKASAAGVPSSGFTKTA